MSADPFVRCDQLVKVHHLDDQDVVALRGLDLEIASGERIGVVGASGSGKSTLLNVLGGLDRPTAGRAEVGGVELTATTERELHRYRRSTVGFVWQQSSRNLLPYLTAVDNVALPMRASRRSHPDRRAGELLALVGLDRRAGHRPSELSGGEQQRVAVAVALANEPALLLADEPTGELDTASAEELHAVLGAITEATGLTQLIVSHDAGLAHHVDRVVSIRDGRVATEHRAGHGGGAIAEYLSVDRFGQVHLTETHRAALGDPSLLRAVIDDDELRLRSADDESTGR
ncbi:MAG: ABC transporter ATP-binding protein [Actinomycetota bacterium]